MKRAVFYSLLLAGLLVRAGTLVGYDGLAGGDPVARPGEEAVVGLLAKHLVEDGTVAPSDDPAGSASVLDTDLAAVGFWLTGIGPIGLRIVPFLLSLLVPVLVYRFVYVHYSVSAARWATVLTAAAPVGFVRPSVAAQGGVSLHLLVLLCAMLLFWRFFILRERRPWSGFALGAGAAAWVWVSPYTLGYTLLMLALLAVQHRDRRGWSALGMGLAVGAVSLLLGSSGYSPLGLARRAPVSATAAGGPGVVTMATREDAGAGEGAVGGLGPGLRTLASVFGAPARPAPATLSAGTAGSWPRPGFGFDPLGWLIPLAVFGVALAACRPRRGRSAWGPVGSDQILALVAIVTLAVGWNRLAPTAAVYPLAAAMAGVLCSRLVGTRRRWMMVGVAAVLLLHGAGWARAWARANGERAEPERVLLESLVARNLDNCFSVGPLYPLVFASRESVIVSALGDDRFASYESRVREAADVCYIYAEEETADPRHRAMLALLDGGARSRRTVRAGSFTILYDFDPRPVLDATALAKVRRAIGGRGTMAENSFNPREDPDGLGREDRAR